MHKLHYCPFMEQRTDSLEKPFFGRTEQTKNEFGFVAELTSPPGALLAAFGGKDNDGVHKSYLGLYRPVGFKEKPKSTNLLMKSAPMSI